MKILVLLPLCLLCISFRSVQSKNLTLTLSKDFCPKGFKCLNSTSFALCRNTDSYFALGKQIFSCPLGKKCDENNPNSCFTQEMVNKLKEERRINFHLNYIDKRKASKTNLTQHINIILTIKNRKPLTDNETVTPIPEIETSIPGDIIIATEAGNVDHSLASTESGESAEDQTTTTTLVPRDESTESGSNEYSEEEASLIPTTLVTKPFLVPTTEFVEEETPNVSTTESIEEETPIASTTEPVEEETPISSTTEYIEEETPGVLINQPIEKETTPNEQLVDESRIPKTESTTQSIIPILPKPPKKKNNEDNGFYVQFIRHGRKKEHIEYATLVDLDHGSVADYTPSYLKEYSEIRMHSGGLKSVSNTSIGHLKSNGIYGIKFEGLLEEVKPGTFNDLDNLVWVKLNGHLLRRIEGYVFTNLNLREIELQGNMINYLAPNAFDNMPYLEKIDLTHNNLKEYDPRWFYNDHKLTEVIFSNNYIQKIPAFAFKNLDLFLRKIDFYFDQNLIKKVHRNVYFRTRKDARLVPKFMRNGWVNTFFLKSNKLHCVPEIVMKHTKHLSLEDNPVSCGCIKRMKVEADARHGDNSTSMRVTKKSIKACLLF